MAALQVPYKALLVTAKPFRDHIVSILTIIVSILTIISSQNHLRLEL